MSSPNIWVTGIFLVVVLGLSGCMRSVPFPNQPTGSVQTCHNQVETDLVYSKMQTSSPLGTNPQVVALTFTPDDARLMVAYAHGQDRFGELVEIHSTDHRLLQSRKLDVLTSGLTFFSEDARYILTATEKDCKDKVMPDDKCWDVRIWETETFHPLEIPEGFNWNLRDIALSGDGKWLLKTMGINGTLTNIEDWTRGASLSTEINNDGIEQSFVAGALSSEGNLVALGVERVRYNGEIIGGTVRVQEWDLRTVKQILREGVTIGIPNLEGRGIDLESPPMRIAFDPHDRWLAVRTMNSIYVFDVASRGAHRNHVNFQPTMLANLRFSPDGSLLAGGHTRGITVLRTPDLKVVLEKQSEQATAIAFSPDGCLLAWGDVEGTVHIVNAPKP